MTSITGEEVVSSIALKVRQAFTTDELKAVYKNTGMQGVQKPYAFIHQVNLLKTNGMRNLSTLRYIIDVRVHPTDTCTDIRSWARQVEFRLMEALTVIPIGDYQVKVRTTEVKLEDNVLHFIVSYSYSVALEEDAGVLMADLDYGQDIKQ